jgi:hypothetical protein
MINGLPASDKWLVVTPQRFSDESLQGYLIRVCEANEYPSPKTILELLEPNTAKRIGGVAEIVSNTKLVAALEIVVRAPPGSLTQWAWQAIDSGSGPYFNVRGAVIPVDALMTDHAQVCPVCLAESGYIREEWELSGVTVCPAHAMVLVDRCPACQKPLQVMRSHLMTCGHCHFDLRQAPVANAMPNEIVLAEYIAALAPYRLKTGTEVHIDHADSLFALGQVLSFETRSVLGGKWIHRHFQRLTADVRRKVLHPVTLALDGNAIDGVALHRVLLAHTAHRTPYLPRELALLPLAEFLSDSGFLSPTARKLLTYGDKYPSMSSAAERFEGRPPQFSVEEEVMTYLDCSEYVWTWLLKHGHIHHPIGELGFDADEVLAAQHRLESLVSFEDMDIRFGVPNLTRSLVDWHVLPIATGARDMWTAVDLQVVGKILDALRVQSLNHEPAHGQCTVRVCDTPHAKENLAEAYATVIARILRSDIEALRWAPPFSLQDLWVAQADAGRLDSQPVVESGLSQTYLADRIHVKSTPSEFKKLTSWRCNPSMELTTKIERSNQC